MTKQLSIFKETKGELTLPRIRGLYKRGDIWWIRYTGVDGRKRFESSKSKFFTVAEKLLIKRKGDVQEGRNPVKNIPNYTFIQLANKYHTWAERQKSYKKSKVYMIRQLTERFGNLPLKRFDYELLDQYQTEKLQSGNKPATINRLFATISHMFTKAVEWKKVSEDILKEVRKVKYIEESNKRLRFLTVEECQTLIECCVKHLKPIVTVALHTGMRRGEILGLKWDQVDLRHGFILLEITKNGERREIPINDTLKEMFEEMPHSIESIYVFTDRNGNPYKEVKKSFKTALQKAGIRDFRFHDLRHTFASQLVMAGVDLTSVKELLGHKSLTMTLRYSHLTPSHKKKAVEIVDNLLNQKSKYTKSIQF